MIVARPSSDDRPKTPLPRRLQKAGATTWTAPKVEIATSTSGARRSARQGVGYGCTARPRRAEYPGVGPRMMGTLFSASRRRHPRRPRARRPGRRPAISLRAKSTASAGSGARDRRGPGAGKRPSATLREVRRAVGRSWARYDLPARIVDARRRAEAIEARSSPTRSSYQSSAWANGSIGEIWAPWRDRNGGSTSSCEIDHHAERRA